MTAGFDLDEIERRVSRASPNDRAYERPMNWDEAATLLTEIRELRAENARLREAVVDLADNIDDWDGVSGITEAVIDTARAALGEPQ